MRTASSCDWTNLADRECWLTHHRGEVCASWYRVLHQGMPRLQIAVSTALGHHSAQNDTLHCCIKLTRWPFLWLWGFTTWCSPMPESWSPKAFIAYILLPWPKKSLQPRYSWDWSAVRSSDIMQHRLQSATWTRGAQGPRVALMSSRSLISHDITWSNCRSDSWISRL